MNYFEVFGLPRKLGVDTAALQKQFYELSRKWHPDFQQGRRRTTRRRLSTSPRA